MKTVVRALFVAFFVLPILSISPSFANNGDHGRGHSDLNDHERGRDRANDFVPRQEGDGGSAPLDGGLSLLLAAGIGLGVKKMRDRNRALKEKNIDTAD
jgi:hypothetical protein